jgi:L-lactate utilization protein LutC
MTKQEFMRFCENYYGEKYDGLVREVMDAYLAEKSARFLDAAAMVLVKRFSRAQRLAPGPAEIEKYRAEILENIPEPPPLPDPNEKMSDEEFEQAKEALRALARKYPAFAK